MEPMIYAGIREIGLNQPIELPRAKANEHHFIVSESSDLLDLCTWMRKHDFFLCSLAASDENLTEAQAYKLYYVFSTPNEDELDIIEFPLKNPQIEKDYPSIREIFPSVLPLEREIYDMFGLIPNNARLDTNEHAVLHRASYPPQFYPLKRTRPPSRLMRMLENPQRDPPSPLKDLPEGMLILPVGPIHAGVIEPGYFAFLVAGEVIEELEPQLGFTHRGIEKLFETEFNLENGWELAEKVSGDSAFAHSMAFCQAVEALAGVEIPDAAAIWRSVFLEMERIYNHIADSAALIHDMAYDARSLPISTLREACVQLNEQICGSRLLKGINRPGGIVLKTTPDVNRIDEVLSMVVKTYLSLVRQVAEMPECRDRLLGTGVLTREEAKDSTGLVKKASGWSGHDFRLIHPQGIYRSPGIRALLAESITSEEKEYSNREFPVYDYQLRGDVFARFIIRAAEVETSMNIIKTLLPTLKNYPSETILSIKPDHLLKKTPNLEFSIGYAEGWRGDIIYFLMKGPQNTIARCKVRDPSTFNWYCFPNAVARKTIKKEFLRKEGDSGPSEKNEITETYENILADFPLINKSFNLSYAGNDL